MLLNSVLSAAEMCFVVRDFSVSVLFLGKLQDIVNEKFYF